jgi:hypothetical protein
LGETFKVNSWRDVAYRTAESISQVADNFPEIAAEMPSFFSQKKFKHASRQLSNGWWLYVNLSSDSVRNFCRRLLSIADIPEDEWQLEEA